MPPNLRDHFDRALHDDPGAALDEMAFTAIAEGGRLRRRRRQRTLAGAGAAVAVLTVLGLVTGLHRPAKEPEVTIAAAMVPVTAPSCVEQPADAEVTDVAIFLSEDAPDSRRAAVDAAVRADPRVAGVVFETRQQAYERFRALWSDSPDFVKSVQPKQIPESFRLRLRAPGPYAAVRAEYAAMPGVAQVAGRRCTPDAPVGGIL